MGAARWLVAAAVLGAVVASPAVVVRAVQPAVPLAAPDIELFFRAAAYDGQFADEALEQIAAAWRDGYTSAFVDMLALLRRTSLVDPRSWIVLGRLLQFVSTQTGQGFGNDIDGWRHWVWSRPYKPHPDYGELKGILYGQIDPRFEEFFPPGVRSSIRLDEVDWGGVGVNGIPPLDFPAHVTAEEADYLDDDNIVFGFSAGGVARAYPKRILAWHELARDRVGTFDLTLVYCTLCGTVIPYNSRVDGEVRTFGTSGLLYQSNKLMFDEETHSLWSSLDGTPVVGPLVGSGLRLSFGPVVTTTWGEWRARHPDTTVLSLDTGYTRDYSEGEAYRGYFATDRLMFDVSRRDDRLANKAEVLVLGPSAEAAGEAARPVALSADFLARERVYHLDRGRRPLVVITSASGANRVFESGSRRFAAAAAEGHVIDASGRDWTVDEDELWASDDAALRLPRVPAHRAFWFAWYAQHPDTELIK